MRSLALILSFSLSLAHIHSHIHTEMGPSLHLLNSYNTNNEKRKKLQSLPDRLQHTAINAQEEIGDPEVGAPEIVAPECHLAEVQSHGAKRASKRRWVSKEVGLERDRPQKRGGQADRWSECTAKLSLVEIISLGLHQVPALDSVAITATTSLAGGDGRASKGRPDRRPAAGDGTGRDCWHLKYKIWRAK